MEAGADWPRKDNSSTWPVAARRRLPERVRSTGKLGVAARMRVCGIGDTTSCRLKELARVQVV